VTQGLYKNMDILPGQAHGRSHFLFRHNPHTTSLLPSSLSFFQAESSTAFAQPVTNAQCANYAVGLAHPIPALMLDSVLNSAKVQQRRHV
jgi:hypothetical protein